ncbi:hypothetical protein J6590_067522 [Homalodisca vitripennis]|nr:hypothetical protein J6590_067522 [Homalodisca vitripennis]
MWSWCNRTCSVRQGQPQVNFHTITDCDPARRTSLSGGHAQRDLPPPSPCHLPPPSTNTFMIYTAAFATLESGCGATRLCYMLMFARCIFCEYIKQDASTSQRKVKGRTGLTDPSNWYGQGRTCSSLRSTARPFLSRASRSSSGPTDHRHEVVNTLSVKASWPKKIPQYIHKQD